MALDFAVRAGQLELAADTSLGTLSCALSPSQAASQVMKLAQSLQDATVAAGICEEICKDIRHAATNRLPIVCELLHLGQLFPERAGVNELNEAMSRCITSVCDALHEALSEMYKYMQYSRLSQLRQASSVKDFVGEKRMQLKSRFEDVNSYMHLASLLRGLQSAEEARSTQFAVRELQQHVQQLERMHAADKKLVKAMAKALVARQTSTGQKIRLSSPADFAGIAFHFSPVETRVVTASLDKTAAVWDADDGSRMHELLGHSDWVMSVAWSPDGARVATGSKDETAAIWDVASGSRVHELQGHGSLVMSVAWSPDGTRVATGTAGGVAAVWDASTGTRMHELRGHSSAVFSVSWSPDGSRVATASGDGTAALWDTSTGTRMHELRGHDGTVYSITWHPDGSRVATASADGSAALWDAATGSRLHELQGHSSSVNAIAWSPDGSKVASGSADKTAAVWDTYTGTRMHELRGHIYPVIGVAWSPVGGLVYTAVAKGIVRIYGVARRG